MEGKLAEKPTKQIGTMTPYYEDMHFVLMEALNILGVVNHGERGCYCPIKDVDIFNAKLIRDACITILFYLEKRGLKLSLNIKVVIEETLSNAEGVFNANKEKIKKVA